MMAWQDGVVYRASDGGPAAVVIQHPVQAEPRPGCLLRRTYLRMRDWSRILYETTHQDAGVLVAEDDVVLSDARIEE